MTNKILSMRIGSCVKISYPKIYNSFRFCWKMSGAMNCSENQVSGSTDDYTREIKAIIPKLTENLHKGQCGRVGIVGGSLEYTGAPYFAAISALKLGADLVYVICCREAAPVIKSYSPELIVYPFLDGPQTLEKISSCLEKLHSLVIGPGLGRDPGRASELVDSFLNYVATLRILILSGVLKNVEDIINYCSSILQRTMPLIIDADGLFLITQKPNLLRNYKGPVILTPNVMEYSRLCQKLSIEESDFTKVAETLNCVLLMKGKMDVICNGMEQEVLKLSKERNTIVCNVPGSVRRCGGQGDILSGCTAVFVAWFIFKRYNGVISSTSDFFLNNRSKLSESSERDVYIDRYHGFSLCCYAACSITRHCSHIGYEKYGRSMTASDMISHIHDSFVHFYGD